MSNYTQSVPFSLLYYALTNVLNVSQLAPLFVAGSARIYALYICQPSYREQDVNDDRVQASSRLGLRVRV